MKIDNIDLSSLIPKGKIQHELLEDELKISAGFVNNRFDRFLSPIKSYLALPKRYHLPLRIDIVAQLDSPALYMLVGNGHITFGSNRYEDNRNLRDIGVPDLKPYSFNNKIPFNEYTHMTVIYQKKFMQILVDGKERYRANRRKYMKASVYDELSKDGIEIKLSTNSRTELGIKSIVVTEYNEDEMQPIEAEIEEGIKVEKPDKPTFESVTEHLDDTLKIEVAKANDYLLSHDKIKFRRQIDKNGHKITYLASKHGFSYSFYICGTVIEHSLWWYIVTNSKPSEWHKKNDMMIESLNKIAKTNPNHAQDLFSRIVPCVNCREYCKAKIRYEYGDKKKVSCHGKMHFKMTTSDFEEAKNFIDTFSCICTDELKKIYV